MNQYIFRGKRLDNGEWVYGDHVGGYIVNYIDLATSWEPNTSDHKLTVRAFAVAPQTGGQCTGLVDKNGVKIWEGDIVYFLGFPDSQEKPVLKIVWDKHYTKFTLRSLNEELTGIALCDREDWFEVIGNIHDNPSLIQKE